MFRKVLAAFGIVTTLAPEAVADAAERIALENPGECELKPWAIPVARVEGVAYLFLAWGSDAGYASFKKLLGAVGLFALGYPRQLVDSAAAITYDDADGCEWKPWVYPLVRFVGALYVLVALDELARSRSPGSE